MISPFALKPNKTQAPTTMGQLIPRCRAVLPQKLCYVLVLIMAFRGRDSSAVTAVDALATHHSRQQLPVRALPEKLLIGYGIHCDHVRTAVHDGVNVVIWAFMNIVENTEAVGECLGDKTENVPSTQEQQRDLLSQKRTKIKTGLDLDKIQALIKELDDTGYSDVVHLVSFGGWNGPHLDPKLTAEEWYEDGWKGSIAGQMFHGIDWDLEGHNDLDSPTNVFTVECLEKMGHISRKMKADGYIVGMAPPQSYMNFDNPHFSRYVNLTEPDRPWHPEFNYFGANVYSYLLAKFGDDVDFVSMQLYESYSLAAMAVYYQNIKPEDYLVSYVQDLVIQRLSKFYVDFAQDPDVNLESQYVLLPQSKLVIGLANGWAADPENRKHIFISPEELQQSYGKLKTSKHGDLTPRGFMFWTIEEEGTRDVHLARDISKFLKNR